MRPLGIDHTLVMPRQHMLRVRLQHCHFHHRTADLLHIHGFDDGSTDTALYEYSNGIIGTILGLFAAGAFFGAIFAGWYCDAYGRKKLLSKLDST